VEQLLLYWLNNLVSSQLISEAIATLLAE
jgi:hypothetical protein